MSPHSVPGHHPPSLGCCWFLYKERGAGHHILSSFHGPSNTGQGETNVFTLIKVLNVIHLHFTVVFSFPDALNAAQRFDSLPTLITLPVNSSKLVMSFGEKKHSLCFRINLTMNFVWGPHVPEWRQFWQSSSSDKSFPAFIHFGWPWAPDSVDPPYKGLYQV